MDIDLLIYGFNLENMVLFLYVIFILVEVVLFIMNLVLYFSLVVFLYLILLLDLILLYIICGKGYFIFEKSFLIFMIVKKKFL